MKRLISVFVIIIMILSSAMGIVTSANELENDNLDVEVEEEIKPENALAQKIAEIEAIENIEDKYNIKAIDAWIKKAQALIENSDALEADVEALIAECDEIIANVPQPIASAEDFAAMQADGSYILTEDIALDESYGEFCGFLNGNGKTITLSGADGVFTALNGAVIRNLNIEGDITADTSVGALATNAIGEIYVTNVINNASVIVNQANAAGFFAEISQNTQIYFNTCANNGKIIGDTAAGFLASVSDGEVYLYFYNCVNFGEISCGNSEAEGASSGFVAKAVDGDTKKIEFTYCANFGQINSTYAAGGFFASGKGNIEIYGCVNVASIFVDYTKATENALSVGGFVGGSFDGEYEIKVEQSVQLGSVIVEIGGEDNCENNSVALLVGGAEGTVALKDIVISGRVVSTDNNTYKITSNQAATLENVLINVQLEKRTVFPDTSLSPIDMPNNEAIDKTENTDTSCITEKMKKDCELLMQNLILASTELDINAKIEAMNAYFELLTDVHAEIEFRDIKLQMRAYVEEIKQSSEFYTADSYLVYVVDINNIIASIDAVESYDELDALDIHKLIADADSKLVTLESAQQAALDVAKQNALVALSAKRENAGNMYTAKSYEAYCDAFDAIVTQINDAESIEALEAIDVAALKVAAEVKLVVVIPEPSEDYDENSNNDIYDPYFDDIDDDDEENETLAPIVDSNSNNGCSSSLALSSVAFVAALGLAFVAKKKD